MTIAGEIDRGVLRVPGDELVREVVGLEDRRIEALHVHDVDVPRAGGRAGRGRVVAEGCEKHFIVAVAVDVPREHPAVGLGGEFQDLLWPVRSGRAIERVNEQAPLGSEDREGEDDLGVAVAVEIADGVAALGGESEGIGQRGRSPQPEIGSFIRWGSYDR